jgi:hypothetical protein
MRSNPLKTAAGAALLAVAIGVAAGTVAAERHPEIARAQRALQRVKGDLEHAGHDFGGHRVAALKLIDQALGELQAARQFDKH